MKKIFAICIAFIAIISWTEVVKAAPKNKKATNISAQPVVLNNLNDSMNYALGVVNGAQITMYQLRTTPSTEVITEFIHALQRGYDGRVEILSETAKIGKNIGMAIKAAETAGLADNPAWAINQKIFFQGLVNGMYNDTTVMPIDTARNYFQEQYQASALANDSVKLGKAIKGKCGFKVKTIALKNQNDSITYAFGYLNGSEVVQYVLSMDTTKSLHKEFITYVNIGLGNKTLNPQLVDAGEQIGKSIKDQESSGLIGEPSLSTNFELIKQGFINGMLGYEEQMTGEFAGEYIQNTMNTIQYGNIKEENEKFLEKNALREGIITTPSGLQYEIITMGDGKKPLESDIVKVHYHGTLIDGNVFDSSVQRGEPISFGLNQVIAGWTEGLQLMPIGSKFRFFIPQELGYGAQQAGSIPPYSTLIFEVELLDIE